MKSSTSLVAGQVCSSPWPAHLAAVRLACRVMLLLNLAVLGCSPAASGSPPGGLGRFVVAAPFLTARKDFATAALVDGTILVAGGLTPELDSPPTVLRTAEVFDVRTRTVHRTRCDMHWPRMRAAAVGLPDGRALIVGGDSGSLSTILETEFYDPRSDCFEQGPSLRSQRQGVHEALLLTDGRVLVLEGFSRDGSVHGGAEILDAQFSRFTEVDRDLGLARERGATTVLSDGKVLLSGGMIDRGTGLVVPTDRVLLFDPASSQFRELAARLGKVRESHASVLLRDGRVLIVGGLADGPLRDAEVFDPRNEAFSPLSGQMAIPRVALTAVRLPSGDVLVIGGKPMFGQEPHRLVEALCGGCQEFRALAQTVLPMGLGHWSYAFPNGTLVVVRAAGDPPRDSVAHVEVLLTPR